MAKKKLPDYDNCITCLANSILKKFGVEQNGKSLEMIDRYLEKEYRNIVVIVLDAMGKCIVERNLDKNGFFNNHMAGELTTVFPSTTVAATTSVISGFNPVSTSWLGWDCYFPQIDKNVTMFQNVEQNTDKPAAEYNVPFTYCGYRSVVDKLNQSGKQAYFAAPFINPNPENFEKLCGYIEELCKRSGNKYIYGYWGEPDNTMHRNGCYGKEAKRVVRELEKQVERLAQQLENTLIIVTADHGHMDTKGVTITDYPKIMECLIRMPSIEARALNLFVKPDKKEQFENEFLSEFGDKFELWTKEKVIESQIFGIGAEHECFRGMLGDYMAIAVDNLSIFNTKEEEKLFKGAHAGITEDEMIIPLIVI